ncbi:MAG: hypothetical protein OHK0048_14630 [Rhodoferax sp.]
MQDSQILSVLGESSVATVAKPSERGSAPERINPCSVGVVLRAVVWIHTGVAVLALVGGGGAAAWLARFAVLTAVVLPAVSVWLLVMCAFCTWGSQRLAPLFWGLAVALGGAVGACAGWLWLWIDPQAMAAPMGAAAALGAWLAGGFWIALQWRSQGQAPAAARARLAELQARIRPHFLFNTLNSAIALVRAEPARAERLLEDLSDLFRAALQEPAASVTLGDELALVQRYLAIEQVRFGARLQVSWALDEQAQGARLPPLTLQPLVENAVKHGVEPSARGGEIRISTQRRGSVAVIKITNTLPPGEAAVQAGHGLGMDNVRQRLALLHDVQAQFRFGRSPTVFQVRIEVPL